MVDHINFQKISPSLSNAHKVKRADQKNREQQHQHGFKKFLNQDGDSQTENSEDQKDKNKSNHLNPTQAKLRPASNFDPASKGGKTSGENHHGRRIDVHA